MKKLLKETILRPKWVKYCSQTLYESLFFCNNMYEITKDEYWKKEGSGIIVKIRQIQQNDGGFDIGYEFDFGKIHKKGWSSAPECKLLVSLIEFGHMFGFDGVIDIVEKGIKWILNNSIQMTEDKWAIPYCPAATKEVMIYNGVSFALAPLAMYYKYVREDKKIKDIHDGYINYLYDEFEWKYGYWKYFDQKGSNLKDIQRIKVDNYHLGQQLEMHCYSYSLLVNQKNKEIIDRLASYLMIFHQGNQPKPLPYFNYVSNQEIGVHLWGYASLINGFLSYYKITKKEEFLSASKQIFTWINESAWLDAYFACIYYDETEKIDKRFYPRSDAWVIDNLSNYLRYTCKNNYLLRLQTVYKKIKCQDFSGFENHAVTTTKKIATWALTKVTRKRQK